MTSPTTAVSHGWVAGITTALLESTGVPTASVLTVGESLADSDARGIRSHGSALVPMYLARLESGSLDPGSTPVLVRQSGSMTVLDASHGLGQVAADVAAVGSAREFGVGVSVIRRAFHIGEASRYTRAAASEGLIGLVTSNTRPLMAVSEGHATVGNNPLAIAVPRGPGVPAFSLDIALSVAALNKIRDSRRGPSRMHCFGMFTSPGFTPQDCGMRCLRRRVLMLSEPRSL